MCVCVCVCVCVDKLWNQTLGNEKEKGSLINQMDMFL